MMVWVTRVLEVLLNIVTNGFLIVSLFVLTLFLTCITLLFGGLSIAIARSIYRRLFDKGGKNVRM